MTDAAPSLQLVGDRWSVAGQMTMDSAAELLLASRSLAMPPTGVVDLKHVGRVDSAGVSVLLAWKRRAAVEGVPLQFAGTPQGIMSLAELYGVEEMLTS
jgi:phospholipid transport system transporter-binding protein